VTFNSFTNIDLEARELKRETANFTRIHVLLQGESLSGIAAQVYGNPELWRPIALRNGIDDPRSLPSGLRLVIPQLPFRDPESAEIYQ
jgi:nucleoid-associated protein YgaU